jgi:mono/diheme cytochrome c family protein
MKARILILSLALVPALMTQVAAQSTGKDLYDANCKKCHGVLGTPPKAMKAKFPKLVGFDAAFIAKHSVDSIVTILNKGKGVDMKPVKGTLSPAEITAVAQYVKELAARPRAGGE